MAYFLTREDAEAASEVLDVFFRVLRSHTAEPVDGRPWEITILLYEGVTQETLHVGAEMRGHVLDVVRLHDGLIRQPDQGEEPPTERNLASGESPINEIGSHH